MITITDYAGKWSTSPDWGTIQQINASELLRRVNLLLDELSKRGVIAKKNPITGCLVGGESFGGFRPLSCPIGAPNSAHKQGEAVDIYDPDNKLDDYITAHPELLVQFDLYREHPTATLHWLHLSIRAPKSGNRTFLP